jgi:AAA domain
MAKIYPARTAEPQGDDPLAKAKADCGAPEYRGYTIKGWREVLDTLVPPREYFFGSDFFGLEQIQCIIGQGGLGKSRFALNMARNNVLQLPLCDQPTGTRPLRHLFIGSENDIHRWKIDMACMSRGLIGRELDLLEENIHVTTLEAEGDAFINLGDEDAVARWEETLERFKPDVVWVDPWGDVIDGESCSDGDIRKTLSKIIRLTRAVNPKAGVVILAHARTGRTNIEQCVGYDAPNFLKDGKALYSTSRAVVNLAPYDESEHPLIVMGFAKNNNGKKPVPIVIGLDDKTLTYFKIQD